MRGLWHSTASSKASVSSPSASFDWDRPLPSSPGSPSSSTATYKGFDLPTPHSLKRAQSNVSLGSGLVASGGGGGGSDFRPFMPSSLNPRPPSVSTAKTQDSDSTFTFGGAGGEEWNRSPTRARDPPKQTPVRPANSRSASSTPKQSTTGRPLFSSHSSSSLGHSRKDDQPRDDYGGGLNVGFRVRKKSSKLSLKSLASSAKQSIFSSHSTSGTQPSSPPTSPLRGSPHSPSFASRGPNAAPLVISAPTNRPFCPPSPTPHYPASTSIDIERSASRGLGIDTPGFFNEERGAGGVRGKAAKLLGESVVPSGKAAKLLGMDQGVKPTKPHSPKADKNKANALRVETSRNQSAMGWHDLASEVGSPLYAKCRWSMFRSGCELTFPRRPQPCSIVRPSRCPRSLATPLRPPPAFPPSLPLDRPNPLLRRVLVLPPALTLAHLAARLAGRPLLRRDGARLPVLLARLVDVPLAPAVRPGRAAPQLDLQRPAAVPERDGEVVQRPAEHPVVAEGHGVLGRVEKGEQGGGKGESVCGRRGAAEAGEGEGGAEGDLVVGRGGGDQLGEHRDG